MFNKNYDMNLLCEIFSSLGFKRVETEYNGYGDSGNLEKITIVENSGKMYVDSEIPKKLEEVLNSSNISSLIHFSNEVKKIISDNKSLKGQNLYNYLQDFLWSLLPRGFEINEGGWGTLEIDLKTGEIDLDENDNPAYDGDDSEII